MKELGFNGVRKHQKVEDPRFLYWADRMGLLVAAEMANAYLFNEDAIARMTREWIEVVARDYNHPSIIIWTPVNESWGVPNLADRRQQAHLKALYYLTKSLDDTRLVIDNDGWEHTEVTDLFAIHDYTRTGKEFLSPLPECHAGPASSHVRQALPGLRTTIQWLADSAVGIRRQSATFCPRIWRKRSGKFLGLLRCRRRLRKLRWPACADCIEAIARLPQIAGICYTQLYDVEQEVNGLMTYDRRMKFDRRRNPGDQLAVGLSAPTAVSLCATRARQ